MYWDKKGSLNTEDTVKLALSKASELSIKHIVVASCTGETALRFAEFAHHLVCVTHHAGFLNPGENEMNCQEKEKLQQAGIKILTTTHLLAGVDRAIRNQFGGVYPAEIIAQTLRIMGQGLKVCIEISVMALDAGCIPWGEDIIAVAGSATGADTATVIRPAHSNHFFDTKVREIICKPKDF